jgi:hypothetical protein
MERLFGSGARDGADVLPDGSGSEAASRLARELSRWYGPVPATLVAATRDVATLVGELAPALREYRMAFVLPRPEGEAVETIPSLRQEQLLDLLTNQPQLGRARPVPVLVRSSAPLDSRLVQNGIDALARRHEVLRSSFARKDDRWLVSLPPPTSAAVPMTVVDASRMSGDEVRAHALTLARDASTLDTCFSAVHYEVPGVRSWLLLLLDHLVVDWVSVDVILADFSSLYGHGGSLPSLRLQYYDFAYSQRHAIGSGEATRDLEYWQHQFSSFGPWPPAALPGLRGRSPEQPAPARVVSRTLGPGFVAAVDAAARTSRVLRYSMYLAGACLALDRGAGGQPPDFGVVIVTSGRGQWQGTGRMVGLFTDYLTVGLGPLPDEPGDLLALVHSRVLITLRHDGVPRGEMLRRHWRGSSVLPAMPCVFFDMPPSTDRLGTPSSPRPGAVTLKVVRLQDAPPIRRYPGLAMRVITAGVGGGLALLCEFGEGDANPAAVERLVEDWEHALRLLVEAA